MYLSPPPGTQIDGQNGLANKLLIAGFPTPGGWIDALQKTTGYTATGGSFGVGQAGPKRIHSATTDKFSGVGISNNLPLKDSTLLVIYAKRDTTNRSSGVIGVQANSPGSGIYGVHGPFNDGKVYFDYGGQVEGTTRLSIAGQSWTAFVPSVWIYTTGPRGMEIWRDGVRIASNSANPSRTSIGNAWCLGTHKNSASDLADFYAVQCWGRQLTTPEICLLCGDPFAVYQRPRSYAYRSSLSPPASDRRRQILTL